MAIKCPKCQADNPDTKQFCGDCGTQLPSFNDVEVTETLETPKEELTTGSIFAGRYQIIEELGKGGMGRVYRVLDKQLNEEIAIKLIKPDIGSDKKTIERFRNELKIARKIVQKNIGRMFDLNEEKGTFYITMEYVRGQDLKGLIRQSGQLAIGTTVSIAAQICDGLDEAHKLGVVHRDLKPGNIMIDKEGTARIMDFGIARSLEAKGITGAGVMIGTPEYMSPEQVEGKEVDQRSDIYSLGVILYEMVTGRVPFEGDTPFTIGMKHKGEMPQNPKELNTQISDDLNHLILRCLEKEKEKRYQNADVVCSELNRIEKGIPTSEREIPRKKPLTSKEITVTFGLKKLLIPALAIVAVVIAVLIILQILPREKAVSIPSDKPSIAVLPFQDLSSKKDHAYLCDGMTEELIAKLSKLKDCKVMNRNSVMQYKWTEKDIKEIGQELNVGTILLGTVRKEGDDIRVTAQLVNVEDRFQIWADTYEQKLEHVFMIQSEIAEKIVEALQMELSLEAKEQIQKRPTENLKAYNLYLQGRYYTEKRTGEDLKKAIEYFNQAIDEDHNYAHAHLGLATVYNILPEYSTYHPQEANFKATEAIKKALEIDETLAEAHAVLASLKISHEFDWSEAEKEFKRAIELDPNSAVAHHWYALMLGKVTRYEEAIEEIKLAHELDPLSLIINKNVGLVFFWARKYDKAIESFLKTVEMDQDFPHTHFYLGDSYLQKSMLEDALREFQIEREITRGINVYSEAAIGVVYVRMGKREMAEQILNELIDKAHDTYISPYGLAWLYFALEKKDQGFESLERAYEERASWLSEIKVEPLFNSVRSDPRFISLLRKMNLK